MLLMTHYNRAESDCHLINGNNFGFGEGLYYSPIFVYNTANIICAENNKNKG